jgi:hypothetical protein
VSETETKTLTVTQEDIDAGGHSAQNCPFALAARRLFPGWPSVTVVPRNIYLSNWEPCRFEQWDLDAEGTAAILRYDATEMMEPDSYTLTRSQQLEAS